MTDTSPTNYAGPGLDGRRSGNPADKPKDACNRKVVLAGGQKQTDTLTFNSAAQRARLLEFASALGSRGSALRRDECGDPRINGRHGHVYAAPTGLLLVVLGWSARGWGKAKRSLSFAKLSQDGDDEGILILDRLPTKTEAERHYLGVAKRKKLSPERLAGLTKRGFKSSKNRPSPTGGGVGIRTGP